MSHKLAGLLVMASAAGLAPAVFYLLLDRAVQLLGGCPDLSCGAAGGAVDPLVPFLGALAGTALVLLPGVLVGQRIRRARGPLPLLLVGLGIVPPALLAAGILAVLSLAR